MMLRLIIRSSWLVNSTLVSEWKRNIGEIARPADMTSASTIMVPSRRSPGP